MLIKELLRNRAMTFFFPQQKDVGCLVLMGLWIAHFYNQIYIIERHLIIKF